MVLLIETERSITRDWRLIRTTGDSIAAFWNFGTLPLVSVAAFVDSEEIRGGKAEPRVPPEVLGRVVAG